MKEKLLLIGAGSMAIEHAKVLIALNINFDVVGRGNESANKFEKNISKKVFRGGIVNFVKYNKENYTYAVLAVNEDSMLSTIISIEPLKIKCLLIEKPGGRNIADVRYLSEFALERKLNVFIAYNRRNFASVYKAKEIIKNDGGVKSFFFEFTEWSHIIQELDKSSEIKQEWFFANSTHVIDLAFYLGGFPSHFTSYISGGLSWHSKASMFAGAGKTDTGALFSYSANWEAPGRWGVEFLTQNHRLFLRPLEKLQVQKIGSIEVDNVEIDDSYEVDYKPGFYAQMKAFIEMDNESLLSLSKQVMMLDVYEKILNGEQCKK